MFQPQGYGPLRLMEKQFVDGFAKHLGPEDVLVMPEPVYYGGTTDRSVSSIDIVTGVVGRGKRAENFETRVECGQRLLELAQARRPHRRHGRARRHADRIRQGFAGTAGGVDTAWAGTMGPPFKPGDSSFSNSLRSQEKLAGWGGRVRTSECRNQNPVPYHLATPQSGPRIRPEGGGPY